jgi:hypothetical protein
MRTEQSQRLANEVYNNSQGMIQSPYQQGLIMH